MSRIYNFGAGPATLPEPVLETVKDELFDWHGTGMSIMEISHRSEMFMNLAAEIEKDARELLNIPNDYQVLFLQGGARLQFSMIPMNLLAGVKKTAYLDSGIWSQQAIEEAKRYSQVHLVASAEKDKYQRIPDQQSWDVIKDAAYFYYVDNETVNGLEFPFVPETNLPLVSDMSSNLYSRPVDVSKFGLIFACAQKNIGPAGLTMVIIRNDLLKRAPLEMTPSMLNYAIHAKEKSLWNTPSTFAWYVAGLVFKWLKSQGGLSIMDQNNKQKAEKLYRFIDQSDFYHNSIDSNYRSRMNVIFTLADEKRNDLFLKEAKKNGLGGLKGHRLLGGMRASIYNAMPEKGVDALIHFMQQFEKTHG